MHIAPGYTNNDWKKLNLDDGDNPDWAIAIDILDARITGRYLDPADKLIAADEPINPPQNRRFGFTIIAIDCLLIETFQSFIEGRESTRGQSRRMFKSFLTTRPSFARYFKDALADQFYNEFRCGILHQAEVLGDSIIWSVGPLLRVDGSKMVVNRHGVKSFVDK